MNSQQRVVVVVATGLALAVVAFGITGWSSTSGAGWFNYAPNSGVIFSPPRSSTLVGHAAVWLAAIAIWTAVAMSVFRSRTGVPESPPQTR